MELRYQKCKRFGLPILVILFILVISAVTAHAYEKPIVSLDSSNPSYIREEGLGYYGVVVENVDPDKNITYQWYCSTKEEATKENWYKIDYTYKWAKNYKSMKIQVTAENNQSSWDTRDTRVLRCKVTVGEVSVYSPVITVTARKAEYLSQVKINLQSGTLKPALTEAINTDFVSAEPSKYKVTSVYWQVYNPAQERYITMTQTSAFGARTRYRLIINVAPYGKYGIDNVNGKTKCYIDGKRAAVSMSSYNGEEYSLRLDYDLSNSSDDIVRVDNNTLHVYDAVDGEYADYLNYGSILKILEYYEGWVKIRYVKSAAKTGYVQYAELFADLPASQHYYAARTTVSIRLGPGSDYDKDGSLSKGDVIYVDRRVDNWYHFSNDNHNLGNKKSGWVYAPLMEITSSDASKRIKPVEMTVVWDGAMNVRSDSDMTAARIGGLKKGDTFVATARIAYRDPSNGWLEWLVFNYKNQMGYILEKKTLNGKKYTYVKESSEAELEYTVTNVAVCVNSSVSIKRSLKPINNNQAVEFQSVDTSKLDSLGVVTIIMVPKEGYSFPADLSKITFDLGGNADFSVLSVTSVKSPSGGVKVVFYSKNFCSINGHTYSTDYSIDKMVTAKANGRMSLHCKTCGLSKPGSTKTITKLNPVSITDAKSSSARQISLKWKKISGAKGYEIQYKTGTKEKVVRVKSASKLTYTLKKLTSKKSYKVRIRAYATVLGRKYYSSWSKTMTVKVK